MEVVVNSTNLTHNYSILLPGIHVDASGEVVRLAILLVVSTVTLILGLSGVVLVLLAISKHRGDSKTFFHSIVTSLVITILVLKCFHMIFNIPTVALGHKWVYGDSLCRISNLIYHMTRYGITYHIILLMFYVIFCIKHPLVARKMDQPKTVAILIVVFWALIFLINVESLAHRQVYHYHREYQFCMGPQRHIAFELILVILGYLIPFIFMIGLCVAIGIVARQRRNNRYIDLDNEEERHLQEFVKMSIIFTILHVIFSFCDVFLQMLMVALDGNVSFLMSMLYPAIVPWILLGCVRDFRMAIKNLRSGEDNRVEVSGRMCNAANVEEAEDVERQRPSVDGEYGYDQPDDKAVLSNKPNTVLVEEI